MTAARTRYVRLAIGTIVVGLVVHLYGTALGRVGQDVLGDALWAAMMVWWLSALAPGWSRWARAGAAYGVCAAVEYSQLSHTPTLDAIRATRVGHLVLGSGFDSRDLVAYAAGVVTAMLIDRSVSGESQRA